MPKLDVDLSQEMIDLLDAMVATKRYVDRSDVLRAILRDILAARETVVAGGGDTGGDVTIKMRVIDLL